MDQDELARRLSDRLKAARRDRGLTLEQVSRLSGVSRSMLSQIERGESSPTVATLWNLTRALNVDFAGLVHGDVPHDDGVMEVMRADRTPVIDSRGTGCRVRILSPPALAGSYELYDLDFADGGALRSEPHRAGSEEHLTVLAGRLRITSGDRVLSVGEGDTARYRTDRRHAIEAEGGPARAILVVING